MKTPTELGWIKIHRQITKWEWFDDANTFKVFVYLLLYANHEDKKWKGIEIKRGQFITSKAHLATECNLSRATVIRILNNLEKSGEIEQQTTNKFTLITIQKYENYQGNEKLMSNNLTPTEKQVRQQTRQQTRHNEEVKNNKKEKNISTATPDGDHFNFNTPEKITIQQELDIEIFWNTLLGIHKSESDKGLFNKKLVKKQKQIINEFTKDEREKILEWFRKYKSQLEIAGTWVSTFFQDNKTIDEIANYFRSIKDVKETKKKDTFAPLSVKFKNNNTNF